jgi:hypothetical protein
LEAEAVDRFPPPVVIEGFITETALVGRIFLINRASDFKVSKTP